MKMKKILTFITATLILCSFGTPSFADGSVDKNLTQQVSDILKECEKIKPGMTRADLLKVFTIEGGFSTVKQRTFVYRSCPIIKVDVDFAPSDPKQNVLEERPTDTVSKISKPYLEWIIVD